MTAESTTGVTRSSPFRTSTRMISQATQVQSMMLKRPPKICLASSSHGFSFGGGVMRFQPNMARWRWTVASSSPSWMSDVEAPWRMSMLASRSAQQSACSSSSVPSWCADFASIASVAAPLLTSSCSLHSSLAVGFRRRSQAAWKSLSCCLPAARGKKYAQHATSSREPPQKAGIIGPCSNCWRRTSSFPRDSEKVKRRMWRLRWSCPTSLPSPCASPCAAARDALSLAWAPTKAPWSTAMRPIGSGPSLTKLRMPLVRRPDGSAEPSSSAEAARTIIRDFAGESRGRGAAPTIFIGRVCIACVYTETPAQPKRRVLEKP
mmetsp:Transcript_7830/g.16886  ORF Transcript_7830/g.16886 Transcript_7830/m.16886 type:complete len:320 (+) Transcript_7830:284-1243(+)